MAFSQSSTSNRFLVRPTMLAAAIAAALSLAACSGGDDDQLQSNPQPSQESSQTAGESSASAEPQQGESEQPVIAEEDDSELSEDTQRRIRRLGEAGANSEGEWVPESFDIPDPASDVDLAIERAEEAMAAGNLIRPAERSALQYYLSAQSRDANNQAVANGLRELGEAMVSAAQEALANGETQRAVNLVDAMAQLPSMPEGRQGLQARLTEARAISSGLSAAARAAEAGQLVAPANQNALYFYRQVLEREPGNTQAQEGLEVVQRALLDRAETAAGNAEYADARRWVSVASDIDPDNPDVASVRLVVEDSQAAEMERLSQAITSALDSGEVARAAAAADQLEPIADEGNQAVSALIERVRLAQEYGRYQPGDVVQDDATQALQNPPQLVVVPPGTFRMGSPGSEVGREDNEGPQRTIQISTPIAMARNEVTVQQFNEFVGATGYRTTAERRGESVAYNEARENFVDDGGVTWRDNYMGEDASLNDPVVHVSWEDASAYAQWLSEQTGNRYRLPSEAEFEYALRAGSTTRFFWGSSGLNDPVTNVRGSKDRSPNAGNNWASAFYGYGDSFWGPAPVGSFPANSFGLYDVSGNVAEWMADCYSPSLSNLSTDGEPYTRSACDTRVVRGAGWASHPQHVRSAYREAVPENTTDARIGFRVVKVLGNE